MECQKLEQLLPVLKDKTHFDVLCMGLLIDNELSIAIFKIQLCLFWQGAKMDVMILLNGKYGGESMAVSYDKLWVILNERKMMKTDLIKAAKISTNAMAKLGKNEDVRVGVLVKICETLDCKLDDIVDIV